MAAPITIPNRHLTGALPPEKHAAAILEIERELDEVWPVWKKPLLRGGRVVGIVGSRGCDTDLELRARVKYLLQRRKLLYHGHDVEVSLVAIPGKEHRMVAMPAARRPTPTPEHLAAAARVSRASKRAGLPLPEVARQLGIPLEQVERAVLDAPAGADLLAWVKAKLAPA